MESRPAFDFRLFWGAVLIGGGFLLLLGTMNIVHFPFTLLFFGGLGLCFVFAWFMMNRAHWWPIIPAGALISLALLTSNVSGAWGNSASLFFFGLGVTFGLVYVLSRDRKQTWWALIPMTALWFVALIVRGGNTWQYAFPLAMIAAGVLLFWRR